MLSLSTQFSSAFAQSFSFDNKPICFEQKGNWRKFSNSCADSCEAKFDEFALCTQSLSFACDCGVDRCWHENKCIAQSEYKIIFDKKAEEEEKHLDKLRTERIEKFNNDPAYAYHIRNLYPKPVVNSENQNNKKGKKKSNKAPKEEKKEEVKTLTQPIPPAFMQQQNKTPINSNGQPQDLVFPVIPLPEN